MEGLVTDREEGRGGGGAGAGVFVGRVMVFVGAGACAFLGVLDSSSSFIDSSSPLLVTSGGGCEGVVIGYR